MKWTIKLVFEAVPGSPVEHEMGIIERAEKISPATVGLSGREWSRMNINAVFLFKKTFIMETFPLH
jgi:hypothetical protein